MCAKKIGDLGTRRGGQQLQLVFQLAAKENANEKVAEKFGLLKTYVFCSITRSIMDCRRSEALLARPVREPVGGK